jgi:sec-independent protein translocase protein TatA
MFSNLGVAELLIIGTIVLVFFGSKKLNDLARGLGKSTKEYKSLKKEYTKAMDDVKSNLDEVKSEVEEIVKDEPKKSRPKDDQPLAEKTDEEKKEPREDGAKVEKTEAE